MTWHQVKTQCDYRRFENFSELLPKDSGVWICSDNAGNGLLTRLMPSLIGNYFVKLSVVKSYTRCLFHFVYFIL